MEGVESGGDKYSGKQAEPPSDPAMQRSCYKVDQQVEGKPAHWGYAKYQKRNEPYRIGKEEIHGMEARSCGKVQVLLRMMRGVESPHETPFMLKPVSPVLGEVHSYKPEDSPPDRMQVIHEAELQESELRAEETK